MAVELDPREAEFQAQIESLREQFMCELPARHAALDSAWSACADAGDEAPWLHLRDVAHRLSGSAPCYGLDAVGEAARELDRLLSGRSPCRERAAAAARVLLLQAALDTAIAAT
ncbi:MAG TPA: Hpt domain-containing protein [Rhodanobacteraceae bacterium]|nr:Hpt domain-containing protein [Rhodanobacteraceae bacterium]